MSENNPEGTRKLHRKQLSFKKTVGLTMAAAGTAAIGFLGADREARGASTVDNTPTVATATRTVTPPSTATSTPTDTEKQIAAMQTVVAKAVDEAQKQRILKDLQTTATALAETPTTTPKPTDTATPGPKLNEVVIAIETVVQSRLDEKAAATARAMPTATSTPSPARTPTPVAGGQGQEGGVPWGLAAIGGGAVALLSLVSRRVRNGITNGVRRLTRRGP